MKAIIKYECKRCGIDEFEFGNIGDPFHYIFECSCGNTVKVLSITTERQLKMLKIIKEIKEIN